MSVSEPCGPICLAIDASEQAEEAFNCEYIGTLLKETQDQVELLSGLFILLNKKDGVYREIRMTFDKYQSLYDRCGNFSLSF